MTAKSRVNIGTVVSGKFKRILNCIDSSRPEDDWTIDQALESGIVTVSKEFPEECDLREDWWTIRNQEETGACVGFATADGVLRWHYTKKNWIEQGQEISPRFIWMANKETDQITEFPTTFIELAGTQTKLALGIARKFGAVTEDVLPMNGPLFSGSVQSFYIAAARLRITSYHNLGTDLDVWRRWLAFQGPILARLNVDESFYMATPSKANLNEYDNLMVYGGHAVAIVGYGKDNFIIRNSWGDSWGDKGFAYASIKYTQKAFTEAYGITI